MECFCHVKPPASFQWYQTMTFTCIFFNWLQNMVALINLIIATNKIISLLITQSVSSLAIHLLYFTLCCSEYFSLTQIEPLYASFWNTWFSVFVFSYCYWVAKSWQTLCNPMDCSMPGFPVLHYIPEFAQTNVHWSIESMMSSNILSFVIPFSSCPQSFPESGSFPMSQLFASSGPSIGASASVLPMNIQGWFPLGLTGWISLLSKGLSRFFSSTTIQKHQQSII